MRRNRWLQLLAALFALALVAAACGNDDDDTTTTEPDATEEATDEGGDATAEATEEPTDEGATEEPDATEEATEEPTDEGEDAMEEDEEAAEELEDESMPVTTPIGPDDGFTCEASGGTLVFGMFQDIEGFDPNVNSGSGTSGGSILQAVYDSLFVWDAATGQVVPNIATDMTTDDAITWTLTLRDDVTYPDGAPLDADAVMQHIERHKSEDNLTNTREFAEQVESMTVIDDTTLELTLVAANATYPQVLTEKIGNVPNPRAYTELDPAEFNTAPPEWVGAGPFIVESWTPDDMIVMTRNPDYWAGPERPCLDGMEMVPIQDAGARYDTLGTGDSDVIFLRAPSFVVDGQEAGYNTDLLELKGGGQILYMNLETPGLDDVRIRQAIAMTLDPQTISDVIDNGKSFPTRALFPDDSPWLNQDLESLETDPDAAAALVEEYEAENGDLTLQMDCHTAPERRAFGELVAAELPKVGIDVDLNISEIGVMIQEVLQGNYEMVCWGINIDADPEPIMYVQFHTGSPGNRQNYSNPRVDELLEIGRESTDFDTRKEAYDEVQQILAEEIPGYVYGFNPETLMHDDSVVGGLKMNKDVVLLADEAYLIN